MQLNASTAGSADHVCTSCLLHRSRACVKQSKYRGTSACGTSCWTWALHLQLGAQAWARLMEGRVPGACQQAGLRPSGR